MPRVTRTRDRVTADHIRYLAARTNTKTLVDTTDGIALIDAGQVFAPGSNVTRLLLAKEDLAEEAHAAGLTLTEYLDRHATEIAADLNKLREEQ